MKRIIILFQLLLCAIISIAQSDSSENKKITHPKWSFHSVNEIGLLEGERGSAFQLQTINGVEYKNWFTGIGVGLDYYLLRTIPVFIDVRKNLLEKSKSPFLYANAGVNFVWVKKNDQNSWYKSDYNNGLFYEAGIGYTIQTKKNGGFTVSLGYSEKRILEKQYSSQATDYVSTVDYIYPYTTANPTRFNYQLRRVAIKVGWKF